MIFGQAVASWNQTKDMGTLGTHPKVTAICSEDKNQLAQNVASVWPWMANDANVLYRWEVQYLIWTSTEHTNAILRTQFFR